MFINGQTKTLIDLTWDIKKKDNSKTETVLAVNDTQLFVYAYREVLKKCEDENISINDIAVEDVAVCSVCEKVLMPDDECYTDENTNEPLCDKHSVYNEKTGNYKKIK